MKCEEAQLILTGFKGNDSSSRIDEAIRHARECRECADLLAFDEQLTASLETEAIAPHHLLVDIRQAVTRPKPRPFQAWTTLFGRSTNMKKIIVSAASVAIFAAATIGFLARPAVAAEPKAKFKSMKKAVLASTRQMTDIEIKVGKKSDGTEGSWVIVDGQLRELRPGDPVMVNIGEGGSVQVSQADMNNLDPATKAKVQEALNQAMQEALNGGNGSATITKTYVNGEESSLQDAQNLLRQHGINLTFSIDLDESHYQSIEFGKDQNTLVLTPKSKKDSRYVVRLDPKSNLPSAVVLEQSKNGKWSQVKTSKIKLASKGAKR